MSTSSTTHRIEPKFLTKIWGTPRVEPWFDPRPGEKIGEVWFPADQLLIKFLFTSENLSVQVHPDEDYACRHENAHGKTEMWHILRADPGARIALGFKTVLPLDTVMAAAQTGEIMNLLNWMEVHAGETYFVPSGTVHALGEGLAVCEIQQNSDVTYRLYDYGRERQLHLRAAEDVLHATPHPGISIPRDLGHGVQLMVECPWFRTYHVVVDRKMTVGAQAPPYSTRFLVVLDGRGFVDGLPAAPGQVFDSGGAHEWCVEPELSGQSGSMKVLMVE